MQNQTANNKPQTTPAIQTPDPPYTSKLSAASPASSRFFAPPVKTHFLLTFFSQIKWENFDTNMQKICKKKWNNLFVALVIFQSLHVSPALQKSAAFSILFPKKKISPSLTCLLYHPARQRIFDDKNICKEIKEAKLKAVISGVRSLRVEMMT